MRVAVFSCLGLGDGVISLVLAHNLRLHGKWVDTFHPFLFCMQGWFPGLTMLPFPAEEHLIETLAQYDEFFLFYEKSTWMQKIQALCAAHWPSKLTILNPIATTRTDYPYWAGGQFDGNRTFVENLYIFCRDILHLPRATTQNGLSPPLTLVRAKHSTQIVIHPTSSRASKNWTWEKFCTLADQLEDNGWTPVFLLSPSERIRYPTHRAPPLASLGEMATLIYESGWMLGNDSGIGHLASCMGLPTLIIGRSAQTLRFWRPDWSPNVLVHPPPWIPNIKLLRWRDQHWQTCVSVRRVLKTFSEFTQCAQTQR